MVSAARKRKSQSVKRVATSSSKKSRAKASICAFGLARRMLRAAIRTFVFRSRVADNAGQPGRQNSVAPSRPDQPRQIGLLGPVRVRQNELTDPQAP